MESLNKQQLEALALDPQNRIFVEEESGRENMTLEKCTSLFDRILESVQRLKAEHPQWTHANIVDYMCRHDPEILAFSKSHSTIWKFASAENMSDENIQRVRFMFHTKKLVDAGSMSLEDAKTRVTSVLLPQFLKKN